MKLILSISLLAFTFLFAFSQDADDKRISSRRYDSLINLYENVYMEPSKDRIDVISPLVSNSFDGRNSLDDRIDFLLDGISILHQWDSTKRLINAYNSLGRLYWLNGDPDKSIQSVYKMAELAKSIDDKYWEANAYANIGESHKMQKNYRKALHLEKKARELYVDQKDTFLLFTVNSNMSGTYYEMGLYDSAKFQMETAFTFLKSPDDYRYQYVNALLQGTQAKLLALERNYDSAKALIKMSDEVFKIYQNNELNQLSALNNIAIGRILLEHKRTNEAIEFASIGYNIGMTHGLKEVIQDGAWVLANAYELQKEDSKSLQYYKTYYTYRDSIVNVENVKQVESLRADFEINQKQTEVDLLQTQKKNQQAILILAAVIIIVFIILLLVIFAYYRSKTKVNRILEDQKASLERLNETKDKFFSIISHDLRGPIHSLMGIGKLIRHFVKEDDKQQLLEMADDMETSVERLTSLLDNLLGWAMQQQGHFPNVPEKVNLNQMIEEVNGMFSNMADSKRIALTSSIEGSINLWVDKNTTHTILRNLLNNSIKFTPDNGRITVEAIMRDELAVISISDTGVGMPKTKIDRLFKLSTHTSTYGTSGEKGLGLGLQLVKEFIEMNNGLIEVDSTVDSGTTFTISLPLFERADVLAATN